MSLPRTSIYKPHLTHPRTALDFTFKTLSPPLGTSFKFCSTPILRHGMEENVSSTSLIHRSLTKRRIGEDTNLPVIPRWFLSTLLVRQYKMRIAMTNLLHSFHTKRRSNKGNTILAIWHTKANTRDVLCPLYSLPSVRDGMKGKHRRQAFFTA